MKIGKLFLGAAVLAMAGVVSAETLHQKREGEDGTDKKYLEVKEMKDASGGRIARVKGSMNQWGYVSYWMGIATPEGPSIIRIRVYNDGEPSAAYGVYKHGPDGQELLQKLTIPADAKKDAFVDIDIPVKNAKSEWGGVTLKKFEKNDKPGPWIDTVSVLLP